MLPKPGLMLTTLMAGAMLAFIVTVSGQTASRLTVELDADSTRADGPNGVIEFAGVTIRQGDLRVRADNARSSGLDFENSAWTFSGAVEFRSADTRVVAGRAVLRFSEQRLTDATLEGAPLRFEQQREAATSLTSSDARLEFDGGSLARAYFRGDPVEFAQTTADAETRSRADSLVYDAVGGVLTLQDNAWIGEGGREISGNRIMYDFVNQKIVAASDANGQERVRITITPPEEESEQSDETEPTPQPQ